MYETIATFIIRQSPRAIWRAITGHTGKERLKLGLIVLSLVCCSMMAGVGVGATILKLPNLHTRVNTSLFMQAAAVPAEPRNIILGAPNTETTLAVDSFKLEEIAKQVQASIDDRKTLHDEVYAVGVTETDHFNSLNDRMNVSQARVSAIGWVLGVLFTFSQSMVLFFHLDKRRADRAVIQQQKEETPVARSRPRSRKKN